jgi:hypothetical protein
MPIHSSYFCFDTERIDGGRTRLTKVTNFRQIFLVFPDELRNILAGGLDLLFICTNVQSTGTVHASEQPNGMDPTEREKRRDIFS